MINPSIHQLPCGIFCFADDGTLVSVNDTFLKVLHLAKEDVLGKNVESVFTIPTRIFFQTHLFPLVKMHGFAEEIFLTIQNLKGEQFPILLNANRISSDNNAITTCAFILVSNRKKFEDELVKARKSAENALKDNTALKKVQNDLLVQAEALENQMNLIKLQNQELKQFSHAVTHNLKEPLRKILFHTNRLTSQSNTPTFKKLLNATEQMNNVVSGLQQFVWLNEKQPVFSMVDLNEIVRIAHAEVLLQTNSSSLDISWEKLPFITADPELLKNLFYQLIHNAVKFSGEDSARVRINSEYLKHNKFKSLGNHYKYDDFLRIIVKDHGLGFDLSFKEEIFELFKKLHPQSGIGLGLALCKIIVEKHGGRIEAFSKQNQYTEIIFWLPLNLTST